MKVNKILYLNFNASANTSYYVNVNFPVKSIHIKSVAFTTDQLSINEYFTLTSDLTNDEPMAIFYADPSYSASQFSDVSFQPYKPITVNGTYTFKMFTANGGQPTVVGANNFVSVLLEFNGVDTADT
jgi:hypothetical protein